MTNEAFSSGISPETTALFIEAIARDKAARLKTLSKATVVMTMKPLWVRAEEANALYGIPKQTLLNWAGKGKVIARKLDPDLRGSATIYKVASIEEVIESLPAFQARRWKQK